MGPLRHVVRSLARLCASSHQAPEVVVIAGRNRTLKQDLDRMELPGSFRIEGFVGNMEIWMRASDILVTKAGPNTLAEAFIAGLPHGAVCCVCRAGRGECHARRTQWRRDLGTHPTAGGARRYATGRA